MAPEDIRDHERPDGRREFIRHTVNVPLEVETVSASEARREQSVNVSRGGLAFVSTTCPQVGDLLRLRIPTVRPVFEAAARVAWCRPEEGRYLVGVQFMDQAAAFRSRMVEQVCAIENYRREVREKEGRVLSAQEAAAEWIERYAGQFPRGDIPPDEDGA